MNPAIPNFDSSPSESEATLSNAGGDVALRRINAEQMLHMLAVEFAEAYEAERVRVLPDSRLAGRAGADFLLQIDDYDVRLQLLDGTGDKIELSTKQLTTYLQILEDNPNTVAVLLVWTTDDLKSVPLSVARIRYLQDRPGRLRALLAKPAPLSDILVMIMSHQLKQWDLRLDQLAPAVAPATDLRRLFQIELAKAVQTEEKRSYINIARKQAAANYPRSKEIQLLESVLDAALTRATRSNLQEQLLRLGRYRTG